MYYECSGRGSPTVVLDAGVNLCPDCQRRYQRWDIVKSLAGLAVVAAVVVWFVFLR